MEHNLNLDAEAAKRPLFHFEGQPELTVDVAPADLAVPTGQLTLSGPVERADPSRLPVRGDLAHIRLAGRYFVPHYAVPMPHVVGANGSTLRKSGQAVGEALAELSAGAVFNMLDIAGGWAWGQVGEDGLVGYVPQGDLQ
jgi:hypothetical protein